MGFINENFMLHGKTAERLYHEYAEGLPIIDYHCHLSPKQIAENYQFRNAYDVFLGGDHYKWRLMRAFGIDERHITGDAPEKEKFFRFAEAMPYMIGNPVYHWTHLELKRYFGIDEPLSPKNAEAVWDKVNEMLERDDFRAQALILKSGVEVVCTTDDPADDLHFHESLKDFGVKILPAFRPDKSVGIEKAGWIDYIKNTGAKVLDKGYQDIEVNGNTIRIGGMYDYAFSQKTGDIDQETMKSDVYSFLIEMKQTSSFQLMMAHRPDSFIFGNAYKWNFDLVVSGHYHGGQVILPCAGGLYAPELGWFPEVDYGHYKLKDMDMIVTRGISSSNELFPRFNNPSEIVSIRLKAEKI